MIRTHAFQSYRKMRAYMQAKKRNVLLKQQIVKVLRCSKSYIRSNQNCEVLAPLIPRDVLPAATAFRAYSICTSLPDGENVVREKL